MAGARNNAHIQTWRGRFTRFCQPSGATRWEAVGTVVFNIIFNVVCAVLNGCLLICFSSVNVGAVNSELCVLKCFVFLT